MSVVVAPDLRESRRGAFDGPAWVTLYNDDWHTFDEVIAQLVLAGACGPEAAREHAWRVHTEGRSRVFDGTRADCERVAGVLRRIRLQVEVDWNG